MIDENSPEYLAGYEKGLGHGRGHIAKIVDAFRVRAELTAKDPRLSWFTRERAKLRLETIHNILSAIVDHRR